MNITKSAMLPLRSCRGNIQQRNQKAEKILKKFIKKIEPELNSAGKMPLWKIKEFLLQALPSKRINFDIVNANGQDSQMVIYTNENDQIDYFDIMVEADKNGDFYADEKNSLYHETWHFLENITSPKQLARYASISDEMFNKFCKFYHSTLYSEVHHTTQYLEKKLKKFLSQFDANNRINLLQFTRQLIKGEMNAFSIAEKYAPASYLETENYEFPRKLDIVNKALLSEICAERKK